MQINEINIQLFEIISRYLQRESISPRKMAFKRLKKRLDAGSEENKI